MPDHLKLVISAIVAATAAAAFYFDPAADWLLPALAGLMIFAIWLFPETKSEKKTDA